MSLREKAREIKEHGAAERGNYNPAPNSIPVRLYKRWAELRPEKVPVRENFCHYWRVVLIWAPIWSVLAAGAWFIERFLMNKYAAIAIVLAALAVSISIGGVATLQILGMALVMLYFIASVVGGTVAGSYHGTEDELSSKDKRWLILFPLAIAFYVLFAGTNRFWNSLDYEGQERFKKWSLRVFLGIVLLGALVLLGAIAVSSPGAFLIGVAVFVAILGVIYVLSFLSDYLKMKQAERERNFDADAWLAEEAERESRGPGRVERFFTAIGDFLNLIFQAVRVKKWKICPLVEIPTDRV